MPSADLPLLDLEEMAQEFVLETKQLQIPGHPTACNPSIIRLGNRFLLSFDAYVENSAEPDRIGLVWLDEDFDVISGPTILDIPIHTWQDPRLVAVGNRLYLLFNGANETGVRRMFLAQLHYDGVKLFADLPECLSYFPGMADDHGEKNWVPFNYFDTLLITYSIIPHQIFGVHSCERLFSTQTSFSWEWGPPRGGTASLLDGDHYLAFFHSSKIMATVQSQGKWIKHYFFGAYTFHSCPPFTISAVSPSPIVGKNFYSGPEYKTMKPLRVVFPCGFVFDDHYVWIVYGKQDHEAWVAKLCKKGLYESLEVAVTWHSGFIF